MKSFNFFLFLSLILSLILVPTFSSHTVSVTVSTDKPTYTPSEVVKVTGRVMNDSIPVPTAEIGVEVDKPDGSPIFVDQLIAGSDGYFQSQFRLSSGVPTGRYTIYATYGGVRAIETFKVKYSSSISIFVFPSSIALGSSITVSGGISPSLEGVKVILVYTRPDGSDVTRSITTNSTGHYKDVFEPDIIGEWTVKANWAGDEDYIASESSIAKVHITKPPLWEQEIAGVEVKYWLVLAIATVIAGMIAVLVVLKKKI